MNRIKRTLFAPSKLAPSSLTPFKFTLAIAAFALLFTATSLALAQGASIHGTVTDPAGSLVTKGEVRLTTDKGSAPKDMKFLYVFPLDATGSYKGTGIKANDYVAFVFQGDVSADYQNITVKDGDDKTFNFDMTREEYMKSLSPERRKEIEDYKKRNAAAGEANKAVANLNATLTKVRTDLSAAYKNKDDVSADVTSMKAAVAAKPEESILILELGNAEQAQADHLVKADKLAGKPPASDDDVKQLYSDSVDAYKKAIDLNAAAKKVEPHTMASGYNQMASALAKEGKADEASAAFEKAAATEPALAGVYYKNAAASLFNAGQADLALAAAEKAIAADPKVADPYFIKGQVLIARATVDPKTQKFVPPPGCIEAYQMYLQLAPDGAHVPDVKEILTSFGEKIDTSYKAPKKK